MKCTLSHLIVDAIWPLLKDISKTLQTPDQKKGSKFKIISVNGEELKISVGKVSISKESFQHTIAYLLANNHVSSPTSCEIRASKSDGGPLDIASRTPQTSNVQMVIPYVVGILAAVGIVSVKSTRPNRVWINL